MNLNEFDPLAIAAFLMLASKIHREILLLQPPNHPPSDVPDFLPTALVEFLSGGSRCGVAQEEVLPLWDLLKYRVWYRREYPRMIALSDNRELEELFCAHGTNFGLGT
jgi:hypothetical protein